MKILKILFLVSIFNFLLIGGLVLAKATFVQNDKEKLEMKAVVAPTNIPTSTIAPKVTEEEEKRAEVNIKPSATPAITEAKPTLDSRCVITVEGQRYDVSQFRNKHEGGDIFVCGSDMTAVFQSQHSDEYLRKLNKYKL